jgi:hypothetical protein
MHSIELITLAMTKTKNVHNKSLRQSLAAIDTLSDMTSYNTGRLGVAMRISSMLKKIIVMKGRLSFSVHER